MRDSFPIERRKLKMKYKIVLVVLVLLILQVNFSSVPVLANNFSEWKISDANSSFANFSIDNLNLDRPSRWSRFARVYNESVELIIGIGNEYSSIPNQLMDMVARHNGSIVGTVSIKGKIIAAIVDVSFDIMSSFVAEVSSAKLTRYVEPNLRFHICEIIPDDPYWDDQWGPQRSRPDL